VKSLIVKHAILITVMKTQNTAR